MCLDFMQVPQASISPPFFKKEDICSLTLYFSLSVSDSTPFANKKTFTLSPLFKAKLANL